MHIVIMGCGRVGSSLARALERRGHSVAVIDINADSFRRLGPGFHGRTVKGVGFDRKVLEAAGIRGADGFAAVSSGDNSNILAARVVRETFEVHNVVARIYDQGRAEVYERLGIPSVATVRWASDLATWAGELGRPLVVGLIVLAASLSMVSYLAVRWGWRLWLIRQWRQRRRRGDALRDRE